MTARVALLYPGDRAQRARANPAESHFAPLFAALAAAGLQPEPAVWHDDFAAEMQAQLLQVQAVLVWCNPIEAGRRRTVLDALLRDVAERPARLAQGPRVAGFGHQAVNALHPGHADPGPRLYHDADWPEGRHLRQCLEGGWLALLCERLGLAGAQLPLLWDADFMFGDTPPGQEQRYVLCEANVSGVSPYPPSANAPLVQALCERLTPGLSWRP